MSLLEDELETPIAHLVGENAKLKSLLADIRPDMQSRDVEKCSGEQMRKVENRRRASMPSPCPVKVHSVFDPTLCVISV